MSGKSFLFIGGCARSGTSALHRVVAQHPGTFIGLERYVRLAAQPELFGPHLFEPERFLRVEEGDTFYASLDHLPYYKGAGEKLAAAKVVGDKIPKLHQLYKQIAERFPLVKILYIVRNIFDVAASYNKRAADEQDLHWPAGRNYRKAVVEWRDSMRQTMLWMQKLSIYVVDYETFFAGEEDIGRLASFLGRNKAALRRAYEAQLREDFSGSTTSGLTPLERQYICCNADFDTYRQLLAKAGRKARVPAPAAGARTGDKPQFARKYQDQDRAVVDYRYYRAPGSSRWFRGPAPALVSGEPSPQRRPTVAFLGAASCFGRLVEEPYPTLVGRSLNVDVLNLGYGGTRAPFYYEDPALLDLINRSACAVIELFSARGTGCTRIVSRSSESAFIRWADHDGPFVFADRFYAEALKALQPSDLKSLVDEVRARYVEETRALLRAITVPKILFWFSQRSPDKPFSTDDRAGLMGEFPHFVDSDCVRQLTTDADEFVAVVSSAGLPNLLVDRDTGEPVPIFEHQPRPELNRYYPSPQMHRQAAEALASTVRRHVNLESLPA